MAAPFLLTRRKRSAVAASPICRRDHAALHRTLLASTLSILFIASLCSVAGAVPNQGTTGRWTPSQSWHQIAVQMALLPGDGHPFHSRIVWWSDLDSQTFTGGQWGWRPGSASINCSSYPDTDYLKELGMSGPASNIFCSGLVQLNTGNLLVAGGTEEGNENGLRNANIFIPGAGIAPGHWAAIDSLSDKRWYPTVTELSDARILATSGSKYRQFDFFGGLKNGEALPSDNSLGRYGLAVHGIWDPSIQPPANFPYFWPAPRYGHSAVPGNANQMYFGGRDSTGKLLNEVAWLYRNPWTVGPDYNYTAVRPAITPSTALPDPRFRHGAIMHNNEMVVYGGIGQHNQDPETVRSDVWAFRPAPNGYMQWAQILTNSSPAPSARFGHAAIYDY